MVKLCLVALHRSDIDDIKRMHRSREAGRQLWLSLILGDDMIVEAMAGGLDRGVRGVESITTCWHPFHGKLQRLRTLHNSEALKQGDLLVCGVERERWV